MRRWVVGIAVFAALAVPALAKDIVLPAKEPAVAATVPDDWDTSVYETEAASVSADGDIVFNIATDKRSRLDGLVKESKEYLKKNKVNLAGKPSERVMDFNGTSGQVLRYQATDKNGKTVVDFVTLEASRNRVVLLTVWGSQDDRETNDAAISAIMKSVTIPAGVGGGGSAFWSGGAANTGKTEAGGRADAVKPEPPKGAAVPEPQVSPALGVRRVVFVNRASQSFGDAEIRASDTFMPTEKVITYMEPVGETLVPTEGDKVRFGMVIDYAVRTPDGRILGGQKALIDKEFTIGRDLFTGGQPPFYVDNTLGVSALDPGAYVLTFTLRDKFSDRTTQVEKAFTIVPAPPAASAKESGLCAQVNVRKDLMDNVNAAADFKDGQRRLKDLADPETVLEDRKAKLMTCRYTSVWAETQDAGVTERRMKMTFKMSDDGKDGIDIDYTFDK